MRIVVCESAGEAAFERLAREHEVRIAPDFHLDRPKLLRALETADALIVRNRTLVDRGLLARAPRLAAVGRLGVGLENLDLSALRDRGIALVVPRGGNATSVAEYVMAALLHFARPLAAAHAHTRAGGWARELFVGHELAGARIALLGLGETGLRVARRARSLRMDVLAWAPTVLRTSYRAEETGVRLLPLADALAAADYVSLHLPLTPETHHLVGRRELGLLPPGAVLVNAARGGLVDEAALAEALRSGRLGGAALDVREVEPPPPGDPLAELPNVLLTPHLAGHTEEALERIAAFVAEEVVRAVARARGAEPAAGQTALARPVAPSDSDASPESARRKRPRTSSTL